MGAEEDELLGDLLLQSPVLLQARSVHHHHLSLSASVVVYRVHVCLPESGDDAGSGMALLDLEREEVRANTQTGL